MAYALANMDGIGGYSGWRWIFIIEGLATVVFAAVSKLFIADWPETAQFLNSEERLLLTRRLCQDAPEAKMDHFDKNARRRTLFDWKIYVGYVPAVKRPQLPSHADLNQQHNRVSRHSQQWLLNLFLYTNNPQTVSLDQCPRSSNVYPYLHCGLCTRAFRSFPD